MLKGLDFQVSVLSGVSAGDKFSFHLEPDKAVHVGRAVECELVLQDPTVSRRHAQFSLTQLGIMISDLGSAHGTFHMGFRLIPGVEDARRLSSGDEFKIGQTLFRISFDESLLAKQTVTPSALGAPVARASGSGMPSALAASLKKPLNKVLAIAALLGVLALLLAPGADPGKLPPQLSGVALNLPQNRVIGYWPKGRTKLDKDLTHVDKAQFRIHAADQVIEYSYRSQVPVAVKLGDAQIEQLPPHADGWQRRVLIVRDVLNGKEQNLVFDNLAHPRTKGVATQVEGKFWALRNIRTTPLPQGLPVGVDSQIAANIATVGRLDKSAEGLLNLLRTSQKTVLEMLVEQNVDGTGFGLSMESRFPDSTELESRLRTISTERKTVADPTVNARHLAAAVELTSQLDAELWRRVNSRLHQAKICARTKDYIGAHDSLLSVMQMFPDKDDYRWAMADQMFASKKIVPKKIKANPQRYRDKKYR